MAVYTQISLEEITDWFKNQFDLGEVIALKGISSGIENSNFFLTTHQHSVQTEYVLTIFERLSASELPYYLELMQHLSASGIKVPAPFLSRDHQLVMSLKNKPAALVSKLEGSPVVDVTPQHCRIASLKVQKHQPSSPMV